MPRDELDHRGIIEKIRSMRENLDDYNERTMDNACKKLSDDLYKEKTHYFYELVQNAEDNDYKQDSAPFLRIIVDKDKIIVINNEIGFSDEDVFAITDIGQSNKYKSDLRHDIGEKGIGFKSVFCISDHPQIFSNGFHFGFNAEEKVGYIKPRWIEHVPPFVDPSCTTLVLPLDKQNKHTETQFKLIDPEIILFLKKLKTIEVQDNIHHHSYTIQRKEEDHHVILEKRETGKPVSRIKYRIMRKIYSKPKELVEYARQEQHTSTIEIAFPLSKAGTPDGTMFRKVFSFLPITTLEEGSGFRFHVQCDFLLTSNRGEIRLDNAWNLWLRDCLENLILEAFDTFKHENKFKKKFYAFIPNDEEIHDTFLKPIAKNVKLSLQNRACILDERGEWITPKECLIPSTGINHVIKAKDLFDEFGTSFVSGDIKELEILRKLGARDFDTSMLVSWLGRKSWVSSHDTTWFERLYNYLGRMLDEDQSYLEELKELEIILVEDGRVLSSEREVIFSREVEELEDVFKEDIIQVKEKIVNSKNGEIIKEFLKKMDVLEPKPTNVFDHLIIPLFGEEKRKSKTDDELRRIIRYIRDSMNVLSEWKVKTYIRIETNKENNYSSPSGLFLPSCFTGNNELEIILKETDYKCDFVSGRYKIDDSEEEVERWNRFFKKLGVQERLQVATEKQYPRSEYPAKELEALRFDSEYQYHMIIESDLVPNVKVILASKNERKFEALFTHLSQYWNSFKDYIHPKYEWKRKRERTCNSSDITTRFSKWMKELREKPWIRTIDGKLLEPGKVYTDTTKMLDFTGKKLPVIAFNITNKEFIQALGIKTSIDLDFLVTYLLQMQEEGIQDLSSYQEIYQYINKKLNQDKKIEDAFRENPIIALKARKEGEINFFSSSDVIWTDIGEKFQDIWGYLQPVYPLLEEFFVKRVHVKREPSCFDYMKILQELCVNGYDEQNDKMIQEIYVRISELLKIPTISDSIVASDEWLDFKKKAVLITNKNELWKNDDDVFLADESKIKELFERDEKIAFLKIPNNRIPKVTAFAQEFGLRALSTTVETRVEQIATSTPDTLLAKELKRLFPFILRWIYHYSSEAPMRQAWKRVSDEMFLKKIKQLSCTRMQPLEVIYSIRDVGENKTDVEMRSTCKVCIFNSTLYLNKNVDIRDTSLSKELARFFHSSDVLSDFINILTRARDLNEILSILDDKNIDYLDEDDYELFSACFSPADMKLLFDHVPGIPVKEKQQAKTKQHEMERKRAGIIENQREPISEGHNVEASIENETDHESVEVKVHPIGEMGEINAGNLQEAVQTHDEGENLVDIIKQVGKYIKPNDVEVSPSGEGSSKDTHPSSRISPGKREKQNEDIHDENDERVLKQESSPASKKEMVEIPTTWHPDCSPSEVSTNISEFQPSVEGTFMLVGGDDSNLNDSNQDEVCCDEGVEGVENPTARKNEAEIKREIGRWGEQHVYYNLERIMKERYRRGLFQHTQNGFIIQDNKRNRLVEVQWFNKDKDTGVGFDIKIIENGNTDYIDVKTTKTSEKQWFDVTRKQWQYAEIKGDRYHIYRVSNAGTKHVVIERITNPYQLWKEGKIGVCPVRIRL